MTAADAITLAHLHLDIALVCFATALTVHVIAPVIRRFLDRRRPGG
jgi:hypothetical protein